MKIIYILPLLFLGCNGVSLPRWVHRVKSCPEPNNVTAWIEASKKLNCLHDHTSNVPAQQRMVYHCLTTTYLNETVEFCDRSVPIASGHCPIYNYEVFQNKEATSYNCSKFSSGCPKDMTYSKNVFKHPECLNIDSEKKCFRSEAQCSMQKSTESITVSTRKLNTTDETSTKELIIDPFLIAFIGALGGIVLTVAIMIFVIKIPKQKILTYLKKHLMNERQCEEKQNLDQTECISLLESRLPENKLPDVEVLEASDPTLGSASRVDTEESKRKCLEEKGRQIRKTEQKSETNIDIENGEKKAGKSIRKLDAIIKSSENKRFTDFLVDLSRMMAQETMNEIKTILKDRIQESEDNLGDVSTPSELLEHMDKTYSLYNNLAILQAYSLAIPHPDQQLYEKCLSYGKEAKDVFYFEKCTQNLKGFDEAEFHIQCTDINDYNKGELDILRKSLAKVLRAHPDDMILVGIRKGSIILTFMLRSTFIPDLRTIFSDRNSLKNITYRVMIFRRLTHRVFRVTINGEVLYEPGKKTEEYAVPTVIKETHLKRAEVEKYQKVACEKGNIETECEVLKNDDEDGTVMEFLDKIGGSITDDILASMKMALKDFIDESTLRKLDTTSLLQYLQDSFKIEYNLYFLQWIFEKCSAHQLSEECLEFASKHRFSLIYFQSNPLSGKSTADQCMKLYIENDLEKCQNEVYDLREWIAKHLEIDIGQIMIAGLEKGSVTVVFRVLLGQSETDLMALASTDEFQAGVSRKGVKKIFFGSEKCITVGRAQTFVHFHCSGPPEGIAAENVKKMVWTVRPKMPIDGSKVFLRIKDKQKGKENRKKRTGTKERQRLLEELEPTKTKKCNIVIDRVDKLSHSTRDAVGEHKDICDKTNKIKASSNKNSVSLSDFETLSEEIDSSIIDETFEKICCVPSNIKQKCSSASGRKRKERVETFLNYIKENENHQQIFARIWQKYVE